MPLWLHIECLDVTFRNRRRDVAGGRRAWRGRGGGAGAEHVELSPLGFLAPWGVLGKERCHIGDAIYIGREQLQESLNLRVWMATS